MNQNTSEVEYMTNEQYETQLLITVRTLRIIAKETKSIETILEALDTIEETIKKPPTRGGFLLVDLRRFELPTPTMRMWCAPSCATSPLILACIIALPFCLVKFSPSIILLNTHCWVANRTA